MPQEGNRKKPISENVEQQPASTVPERNTKIKQTANKSSRRLLELMTLTSQGRIRLDISLESFVARNRGAVHCLTDQRARMRASARASGGLS